MQSVSISKVLRRAHLTGAFTDARATSRSIGDQIAIKIAALTASLESGLAVQSTTGNGQSVTFFDPDKGSFAQTSLLEMWQELSELYVTKRAELFPTSWNLNNDWTIYAAMVADDSIAEPPRVSVREHGHDFRMLA